jgi:hypothetical protein
VEKIGEAWAHFYNTLKKVNRVAFTTCFLVVLKSRHLVPVQHEAHEKFTLAWVTEEEIMASWRARNEHHDLDHWVYYFEKSVMRLRELGYNCASSVTTA